LPLTAREYLLEVIRGQGARHVFLVPGGHIDPIVATLGTGTGLVPIVAAHEEGAGFMADGYARIGGAFGACLSIGGPGAANVLPAAIAAQSDRSRVLFVTGDVPSALRGRGAFQDGSIDGTRDVEFLRPATAYSEEVEVAGQLPRQLAAAFRAMNGVPSGPAHLSIPTDVQNAAIDGAAELPAARWEPARPVDAGALARVAEEVLAGAGKIAVLAGRGCVASGAGAELRAFAEAYELPVATTFAAKGVLPFDHRLALGMFGYAGTRRAITALLADDLDVLLVLGSSMNVRDTLYWSRELGRRRRVVQIDVDSTMLGRDYPVQEGVIGDCREALRLLRGFANGPLAGLARSAPSRRPWTASLQAVPAFYDEANLASSAAPVHPARLVAEMRRALPREAVLFVDSGAHRAFAGHYWQSFAPEGVCSATNLGPMGWAIAAAIGGKLARPSVPVAVITGDGCMRMHGTEIATAARYRVPVVFVVSNNGALGNVYLRAKRDNAGAAEMTTLPTVDWAMFARALGAAGRRVEAADALGPGLAEALAADGPFVLDVLTQRDAATPVSAYTAMAADFPHELH
jgi:acetolactate synthase-1/2/3 large subunit